MTQNDGGLPEIFLKSDIQTVHQGDCHVSGNSSVAFSSVLGSCISACVRDEVARVGGMNHYLLATQAASSRDQFGESARYGAFAMEELINKVLAQGTGRKGNLSIKVFGGGNINSKLGTVGADNAAFVRKFLADEGYQLAGEDMEGNFARRVMFHPESGRIILKRLDANVGDQVAREEIAKSRAKPVPAPVDDIELF